jgi:hypothetical protein
MSENGCYVIYPLAADAAHPATLARRTLADYLRMIDAARAVTNRELAGWRDADLDASYALRDRIVSREWTVYHVLGHFAGHRGQFLLLKHLMRDAGLLPREERWRLRFEKPPCRRPVWLSGLVVDSARRAPPLT